MATLQDRFNINSQLEHLQSKYVGTGELLQPCPTRQAHSYLRCVMRLLGRKEFRWRTLRSVSPACSTFSCGHVLAKIPMPCSSFRYQRVVPTELRPEACCAHVSSTAAVLPTRRSSLTLWPSVQATRTSASSTGPSTSTGTATPPTSATATCSPTLQLLRTSPSAASSTTCCKRCFYPAACRPKRRTSDPPCALNFLFTSLPGLTQLARLGFMLGRQRRGKQCHCQRAQAHLMGRVQHPVHRIPWGSCGLAPLISGPRSTAMVQVALQSRRPRPASGFCCALHSSAQPSSARCAGHWDIGLHPDKLVEFCQLAHATGESRVGS